MYESSKFIFEHAIDVPGRTIFLNHDEVAEQEESIGYKAVDVILRGMHILEARGGQDITIYMNSWGGDDYHGLAIYDRIAGSPCQVVIIGTGYVMSMGAWILQAADQRLLTPHATVMIHSGSGAVDDYTGNVVRFADEIKRLTRLMEDTFLEKMKKVDPRMTRARLKRMLEPDTYLTAQRAIEIGLADDIWDGSDE